MRAGVELELSAVRVGDRCDDRQAQPVTVLGAGALGAEAPERLGELRDALLVEHRAAALDDQPRRSASGLAGDVDEAVRLVVAHAVLDHVLDHPRQQRLAARDTDPGEGCAHLELLLGDLGMTRRERVGDDLVERDDRAVGDRAVLRAREHEEALKQRLGAVEVLAQACVESLGLRRHAVGLGDRDVQPRAHHRQRGAQLVRGVGDEPPLRVKRGLQAFEQFVDRVRQLPELIARAG